ncbi:MAG: ABC transporter permease [Bacteroidetes bacterium]|nr:ABC transporter permease [Bacteroidota bacterium]MBS1541345.1 ABC transporter permease [Bacteroidota bacterium]
MFTNYLKIAFRNLTRNSVYSFINIGGLAVGIACSLLISLWVWDEVTYDRFHANADVLGKILITDYFSGKAATYESAPLGPYEFLKTFDSRIKNTAVAYWPNNYLLSVGEKKISKQGQFVSPEFLQMFRFPLLKGSANALNDPTSILITESVAKALFGNQDAMGQMVRLDNKTDFKVAGILKDLPSNSSYSFEFLAPWIIYGESWAKRHKDNWDDQSYPIVVELQAGANLDDLNKKLTALFREKKKDEKCEMFIQPLKEWRLYSHFENGKQSGGMIESVRLFSVTAGFILLIACINFMNLATARSERRAREVGIRKTVGSRRKELIGQFIGESVLVTAMAFMAAIVLVELVLPLYNVLVDKKLNMAYASPLFWFFSIVFILAVGFFAGSYPAFYLSSFNPVKVLKGNLNVGRGAIAPRKVLVSLQFFFSIFLMVGTLVIYTQIQHVKNREVGYDRENLIMVSANAEMGKNFPAIEKELTASHLASSLTVSSSPITDIFGNNTLDWPGKIAGREILFARVIVGANYTKTMGIQVLEGRDFLEEHKSDSSAMLLNKAAVDVMNLHDPVGAQIKLWNKTWTVVGVLDNVLMSSPFAEVRPGFFLFTPNGAEVVTIRLEKSDNLNNTLAEVERVFKKYNPSNPFEYHFVDQQFATKFATINLTGKLASLFAFLAVFITCLGLFGLATFTAEQRTKEIGIRKVLGASTLGIVNLLSKDFTVLVLVGFGLAAPVSWWGLNNYLQAYHYRVSFAWWIIPAAGLFTLGLTLVIVGTQAVRSASANPVNSLRSE